MGYSKSAISALKFLFLLLLNSGSVSAANYLDHQCSSTTLFTPNSTYGRNLQSLLQSLSSNATRPTGFYNLSVGRDPPDVAYGLFLCRGDFSIDVCQDCVHTASAYLLENCPRQRASLIWYDECLVRYSNSSFFSAVATDPSLQLLNTGDVFNPDRFMELLGTTIRDATGRTAADRSGKKFSTGDADFTSSQRLYTLAQCTPDLSSVDCSLCLDMAVGYLQSCCNGRAGGRVLLPSCNVRFELYPFYYSTASRPPPPMLTPSPAQAYAPVANGNVND